MIVAAHYDSKLFSGVEFVGATDSAVPCAMMLSLAELISRHPVDALTMPIQLVFFDGEEALVDWCVDMYDMQ